jgi:hypothetical protein
MICVKVAGEWGGKKYEVLVPAIVDTDGNVTITHTAAYGASLCMAAEANPEQFKSTVDRVKRI